MDETFAQLSDESPDGTLSHYNVHVSVSVSVCLSQI